MSGASAPIWLMLLVSSLGVATALRVAGFQLVRKPARTMRMSTSSSKQPALADMREDYRAAPLVEGLVPAEPLALFNTWLAEATAEGVLEPNAMCLATVSPEGRPSARFVLLKGFDDGGFVFYTNYESRKASELAENPFAAASFW
jgi:pyridoxamine 5'-phosphate oxidase